MEDLIMAVMPPAEVPKRIAILGAVLGKCPPNVASGLLTGAIANMIGNIPNELWEEMVKYKVPPCGAEGCDCHVTQQDLIAALIPIRALFTRVASEEGEQDPGEKGFSE